MAGRFLNSVDDSGVVRASWGFCRTVDEDLARDAVRALDEFVGEHPHPLYIDVDGVLNVTRGAREAFARASSASRVALVGRSPVARMVANFVLGANPLPVPARFFTSEPAAMAWLHETAPSP